MQSLVEAGWNHDQRTVFEGVAKVRPGHYLMCQGFGGVQERPYWDVEYPDKVSVKPCLWMRRALTVAPSAWWILGAKRR